MVKFQADLKKEEYELVEQKRREVDKTNRQLILEALNIKYTARMQGRPAKLDDLFGNYNGPDSLKNPIKTFGQSSLFDVQKNKDSKVVTATDEQKSKFEKQVVTHSNLTDKKEGE